MTTRLLSIVVAIAALAAAISPAARGDYWAGSAYGAASGATCQWDAIYVDAPMIRPKFTSNGYETGGNQWTIFESVLQKHDPQRGWVDVYYSEWFWYLSHYGQTTGDYFWYLDASRTWQVTTQAQTLPMAGRHGYFRYRLRVFWQNKYTGDWYGEESWAAEGMWDGRGGNPLSNDWCYYP